MLKDEHILKCPECGAGLWIPWDEEYVRTDGAASKFIGGGFSHPALNGEFECVTVCECGVMFMVMFDFVRIRRVPREIIEVSDQAVFDVVEEED